MQTIEIDMEKLRSNKLVGIASSSKAFYGVDELFYKIIVNGKNGPINKETLNNIKHMLEMIESRDLENIDGCYPAIARLEHQSELKGYASSYLKKFIDLISATNGLESNQKIYLLVLVSKAIEKVHQRGIAHTDLSTFNILSNGESIGIVDFDDCVCFNKKQKIYSLNTPYHDIAQINDLFIRVFTPPTFVKHDRIKGLNLPKEIKHYLQFFDSYGIHDNKVVIPTLADEYPHHWLGEIKDYVGEDGYLQRHR